MEGVKQTEVKHMNSFSEPSTVPYPTKTESRNRHVRVLLTTFPFFNVPKINYRVQSVHLMSLVQTLDGANSLGHLPVAWQPAQVQTQARMLQNTIQP